MSHGQSFWLHFREPKVTSKSHHRLPIVFSGKSSILLILLFLLKQVWLIVFPCSSGRLGGHINPAQQELRCSSSREQGWCFANQPSAQGALLPSCSQEEAHQRRLLGIKPTMSGRTPDIFHTYRFSGPAPSSHWKWSAPGSIQTPPTSKEELLLCPPALLQHLGPWLAPKRCGHWQVHGQAAEAASGRDMSPRHRGKSAQAQARFFPTLWRDMPLRWCPQLISCKATPAFVPGLSCTEYPKSVLSCKCPWCILSWAQGSAHSCRDLGSTQTSLWRTCWKFKLLQKGA